MVFNRGVAQYVIAYSFKHFNSLNLMVPPSTDNAVHFSEAKISIFYRAMLCRRGAMAHVPVSVSATTRLSVTSRCSIETAKHKITQTTQDSPMILKS